MNYGYNWYPVVINIIARYPSLHRRALAQADRQLRALSPEELLRRTPPCDVSTGPLTPLSRAELREYMAVGRAIRTMAQLPFGRKTMAIVELTDWKRSHNLWGAAVALGLGRTLTQDLRARFVFLTAAYLGYPVRPRESWKRWWAKAVNRP